MIPRHDWPRRLVVVSAGLAFVIPGLVGAQMPRPRDPAPRDSLHLGSLHREAAMRDPRVRQLDLLAEQTRLRLRSLDAERLPAFDVRAQAQHQSDVPSIPIQLPGVSPRVLPSDTYDAHLAARQQLWDPSRGPRHDVERARLAESQAGVHAALFTTRQSVDEAFFTALAMHAQEAEVRAAITGLEARQYVAAERVRGGAALPSDVASIDAELLRRRQVLAELMANRQAALETLGHLTGRTLGTSDALALPDLGDAVARARPALDAVRERPEYEQFARARERIARERELIAARDQPRLSAFARGGRGRPGLDPLSADFDTYWLTGVQVEWAPWSWGTTGRTRETLIIQEQILATEEAAFAESVRRAGIRELAAMDRLERTLATDDSIIDLRGQILRETLLRFDEGVVTSAELVDRETELLSARLARATHHVELARARARLLTLLGIEVR